MRKYTNPPVHREKSLGWSGKKGHRKDEQTTNRLIQLTKMRNLVKFFFGKICWLERAIVKSSLSQSRQSRNFFKAYIDSLPGAML